jgi:hypothetical protein
MNDRAAEQARKLKSTGREARAGYLADLEQLQRDCQQQEVSFPHNMRVAIRLLYRHARKRRRRSRR